MKRAPEFDCERVQASEPAVNAAIAAHALNARTVWLHNNAEKFDAWGGRRGGSTSGFDEAAIPPTWRLDRSDPAAPVLQSQEADALA